MKIFSLTRLLVFESTTSGNEQETSVLSKLITETMPMIILEDQEGKRHPIEAVLIASHSPLIRNILKYEGVKQGVLVPSTDGEMVTIRIDKVVKLPIKTAVLTRIISFVEAWIWSWSSFAISWLPVNTWTRELSAAS